MVYSANGEGCNSRKQRNKDGYNSRIYARSPGLSWCGDSVSSTLNLSIVEYKGRCYVETTPSITFSIHWLTCSFKGDLVAVRKVITDMLGTYEDSDRGGLGYELARRYDNSAVLYYDPDVSHFTVSLPGCACETLTMDILLEIIKISIESGGRCTRLDLAFDGLNFQPNKVWDSILRGTVNTKANRETFRYMQSLDGTHDTVVMGSRHSERYIRIYNKRGYTRVEIEIKGNQAAAASRLVLLSEDVSLAARQIIRSYVDIRDSYWSFFGSVERILRKVKSLSDTTYYKVVTWLCNQVVGALAALDSVDESIVVTLLECGKLRESYLRYRRALSSA